MTKLTDAQLLDEAVKCLEHALQSTAIRDCQCAHCLGFMQEAPLLLAAIKGRSALETSVLPLRDEVGGWRCDNCQNWNRHEHASCTVCSHAKPALNRGV